MIKYNTSAVTVMEREIVERNRFWELITAIFYINISVLLCNSENDQFIDTLLERSILHPLDDDIEFDQLKCFMEFPYKINMNF